jgi:hypothetical protein
MGSTRVKGCVLFVFAFEVLNEVGDETVVEIFTSEVGITSRPFSLTSKIRPSIVNVALAGDLLVEAVSNSSSSRFIANSEHVETGNGSSVFSGPTLGAVEVSGNGDDNVGDGASKEKPRRSHSLKKFLQGETRSLTMEDTYEFLVRSNSVLIAPQTSYAISLMLTSSETPLRLHTVAPSYAEHIKNETEIECLKRAYCDGVSVPYMMNYKILHTNAIQGRYQSCDRDIHWTRHFIGVRLIRRLLLDPLSQFPKFPSHVKPNERQCQFLSL